MFGIEFFKILNVSMDKIRPALIVFNQKANFEFNFVNFGGISNVINKIASLNFVGNGSNTGEALQLANDNILQEFNGMRTGKENILNYR